MVTTDQWQAGAQRLSGSNWCGVGRIHPPGHPPVCPVSGAPRPPEQCARVSASAAFIIQLRSPPAPDLQFANWWTNTHVLKIKTTLKPEFLIKPTRHWTHICVPWICQICECITYKGVCLAAVYNRLHTKNSHQWWVSFETLILCGSIDTRSVSSQIYPAGAGRGDLIMSSVYRFRFSMSSDGTKRIQPKRQTLDEAYSPPGLTRISKLYRILQIFLFMFQPIT